MKRKMMECNHSVAVDGRGTAGLHLTVRHHAATTESPLAPSLTQACRPWPWVANGTKFDRPSRPFVCTNCSVAAEGLKWVGED
jgi:hypothetical protein